MVANINFEYADGATPLDPDEVEGLIPQHMTIQAQLNEWEQDNILQAEQWLISRIIRLELLLTEKFMKTLHKKMFSDTWKWAGQFRKSNKNIGVEWQQIPTQLKLLLDDVRFQIKHESFELDEIAARFHHRFVAIHPFVNGNGRHSRLATDMLLIKVLALPRFSWGRESLVNASQTRELYIASLRSADKGDYAQLLGFIRS
tara:strand:+ start:51805 stop:52407 length:603 start_codon:yes stop_codon:yes gene_type:complete